MPAKSGKNAASVNRKYQAFVGKMTGPKTKSSMAIVLSIGMTKAKELAPVEYGTLLNSSFRRIENTVGGIRGVAGFAGGVSKTGFNYALYLHQTKAWRPRPVNQKAGPAWNPQASPKYLERGFKDKDQQALIKKALKDEYKL